MVNFPSVKLNVTHFRTKISYLREVIIPEVVRAEGNSAKAWIPSHYFASNTV